MSGGNGRRRSRVLRLRRWLLGLTIGFFVLLVGVIGFARFRARKALLNLPHKLGLDIKSETDGYTISRAVKGRTLFTLHAAKAIQHQNGKTTLRDVSITLYGSGKSERKDTIRGAEFDYDQATGVVRAMGETMLDVGASDGPAEPAANAKRLTVQAKGLVFLQKLGVVSTAEAIRFQYGSSEGEAVGADYETDTGVLTLQHSVHLHSMESGHKEQIDAASAQLDRNTRTATLAGATVTDKANRMTAPLMTVLLREAQDEHSRSIQHVHASGGVVIETPAGQRVQAPLLDAEASPENQISEATFRGGVRLTDAVSDAASERAVVRFAGGRAQHVLLAGSAHLRQNPSPGESRTLDAEAIEVSLGGGGTQHVLLTSLRAMGSAKLSLVKPGAKAGQTERTQLSAPLLVAKTFLGTKTAELQSLDASGGTHLVQDDGRGGIRTSSGDQLTAIFAQGTSHGDALQSVVQVGHVAIQESNSATALDARRASKPPAKTAATAERAEFQASTDELALTGSPRVTSDGMQLAAGRVVLRRDTGDADASGSVRGSLLEQGTTEGGAHASEPTQFACDAAHLARSEGLVTLRGTGAGARLWNRSGQVEAPVIQADRNANTLHAFGEGAAASLVKTVLVGKSALSGKQAPVVAQDAGSATRVFSRELVYRGGAAGHSGTAQFLGNVRLLQGSDTVFADTALATVAPGAPLAGGVQTITSEGHIRLLQGGRTATGSRLVYTASDRRAVLTGAPGAPPVVRDSAKGTLMGKELILQMGLEKGDTALEVQGGENAPVQTELDVPERKAMPSGQPRSRAGRKVHPIP